MILFALISVCVMPIIFCINLVEIMKKVKREQPTATNTFWLTASFVFIVWSIAITSLIE